MQRKAAQSGKLVLDLENASFLEGHPERSRKAFDFKDMITMNG